MSGAILAGTIGLDIVEGPPPLIPRITVETHQQAGQNGLAARLLPHTRPISRFTSRTILTPSLVAARIQQYEALIGTTVTLVYQGIGYAPLFLIRDCRTESTVQSAIRARGIRPDGSSYNLSPAAELVTSWEVQPA